MAVYKEEEPIEHHLYGSSRLGLALDKARPGQLKLGYRNYELSNHLGNVLAVITDNVNIVSDEAESEWYSSKAWPNLIATNDYYPFGLGMEGRTSDLVDNEGYRYGFNGKEKDVEGMAGGGSTYDYGFRIYNPRIAKFLSVDPLTKSYPMLTPYQFASNTPIAAIYLDGLEALIRISAKFWKNQIQKALDNNDIERATYLAFKAVSTTLADLKSDKDRDYAQKPEKFDGGGWEGNSPASTTKNEVFPPGLTVTDKEGNFLFAIEPIVKESSWLADLKSGFSPSNEGGGFVLTTKNGVAGRIGSAREGAASREINIDLLMAAIGASGSAAPPKNLTAPDKNMTDVLNKVKSILDGIQIYKDIKDNNTFDKPKKSDSNIVIFKCEYCGQSFQDSAKIISPSNEKPTETKTTHY